VVSVILGQFAGWTGFDLCVCDRTPLKPICGDLKQSGSEKKVPFLIFFANLMFRSHIVLCALLMCRTID